jgi:hypothetical protein
VEANFKIEPDMKGMGQVEINLKDALVYFSNGATTEISGLLFYLPVCLRAY